MHCEVAVHSLDKKSSLMDILTAYMYMTWIIARMADQLNKDHANKTTLLLVDDEKMVYRRPPRNGVLNWININTFW